MYTDADAEISELSCHALGVQHIFPDVRTIIDIGGQDAKVLSLNEKGRMVNFLMNDKCAAGTGRFLDVMAGILQLDINDLEVKAAEATEPAKISSTCTVFAESEVISQLASGVELNNLVAGICSSVASRVASLAKRIGIKEKVCMSGGVARNGGVRNALSKELDAEIFYSPSAQLMGALGAALAAYNKVN
jgi:predicted CoA-substrate-specific enzyme activase